MKLTYRHYVALRDLLLDVDANEDPDDKLDATELEALAIINLVIAGMEKKRRDEDAGLIPRTRKVFREGRFEHVELAFQPNYKGNGEGKREG